MKASELKQIKERLNKELLRRNGYGSVAHLAGPEYQFDVDPEGSGEILEEHGKKTLDLMLQVADFESIKFVEKGDPIPEQFNADKMNAFLYMLESEKRTGEPNEKSSCYGACTGLCVGSCIGLANVGVNTRLAITGTQQDLMSGTRKD
jgi:hypothetical protein